MQNIVHLYITLFKFFFINKFYSILELYSRGYTCIHDYSSIIIHVVEQYNTSTNYAHVY